MKRLLLIAALVILGVLTGLADSKHQYYSMTTNCIVEPVPKFSQAVRAETVLIDYGTAQTGVTNYIDYVVNGVSYLWKTVSFTGSRSQAFLSLGGLNFTKGGSEKLIIRSNTNSPASVTVTYVW